MSYEEFVDWNMMSRLEGARGGIVKPDVSNRFNLNQATEALPMLKDGKIMGRAVTNP